MLRALYLLRRLSVVPVLVSCAALFILMVMTFCDVVMRSSFNAPIEAATELTRILVAVSVFAVLPHISATNGHIAVDLTDGIFHRLKLERLRDGVIYLACGVMMWWPVQRVWVLAERQRDYGDVTEYLNIPQFYVGWFIAGAGFLAMLAMIVVGILMFVAPWALVEDDQ